MHRAMTAAQSIGWHEEEVFNERFPKGPRAERRYADGTPRCRLDSFRAAQAAPLLPNLHGALETSVLGFSARRCACDCDQTPMRRSALGTLRPFGRCGELPIFATTLGGAAEPQRTGERERETSRKHTIVYLFGMHHGVSSNMGYDVA